MANQTKAEAAAELRAAGIEQIAFSRAQIAARNGISEAHYAKLRRDGLGPREVRLGDRVVTYIEDETAWREAMRANSSEVA